MDAIVNPILIDENGLITAYNSDLHILSGFPLDNKGSGIVPVSYTHLRAHET